MQQETLAHLLLFLLFKNVGSKQHLTISIVSGGRYNCLGCAVFFRPNPFLTPHAAYLKNGWSWLDFITTLTSYTPYLPGNATDVSSLRAFRALRPLRTISAYPGIRLLVSTLISAIPLLLDVVLLLAWVFFVFGIIGMQLFMGR